MPSADDWENSVTRNPCPDSF